MGASIVPVSRKVSRTGLWRVSAMIFNASFAVVSSVELSPILDNRQKSFHHGGKT